MAFTNSTPNYGLPQWVANDKPTYLVDQNGAYLAIDINMKAIDVKATDAQSTAATASNTANNALTASNSNAQAIITTNNNLSTTNANIDTITAQMANIETAQAVNGVEFFDAFTPQINFNRKLNIIDLQIHWVRVDGTGTTINLGDTLATFPKGILPPTANIFVSGGLMLKSDTNLLMPVAYNIIDGAIKMGQTQNNISALWISDTMLTPLVQPV